MVNENFLESELGAELELEKPIKEEFESNVDEEDQDEEKDAVNSEATFSEDQKQPGCFEQIETSLDSDVEEPEEKDIKQIEISGMSMKQLDPESPRGL